MSKERMIQLAQPENMTNKEGYEVPENEVDFEYFVASGPGGQHRNKTASAARGDWNIDLNFKGTQEEKDRVIEFLSIKYPGKLLTNDKGQKFLRVEYTNRRSQFQNKSEAMKNMNEILSAAMEIVLPRNTEIPKDVKKKADRRRLDDKKRAKEIKKGRAYQEAM